LRVFSTREEKYFHNFQKDLAIEIESRIKKNPGRLMGNWDFFMFFIIN